MFSSQVFESALSITMFCAENLGTFIIYSSAGTVFSFLSNGADEKKSPLFLLEDLASGLSIPVLYWENSIGRSKSCDIVLP